MKVANRNVQIVAIAALALTSVAFALASDDRPAARAKYEELAAKVRAGDLEIDWQALRVAAAIGEVGDASAAVPAIQ